MKEDVTQNADSISVKYDAFDRAIEKNVSVIYPQTLYSPIGKLAMMQGQTVNQVYLPLPGGSAGAL